MAAKTPPPDPQFYVMSPATLTDIKPISAKSIEEAGRVGVLAMGLTGGVVVVIPFDSVKTFDIAISPTVTLTPRA